METIKIDKWSDYEKVLRKIRTKYKRGVPQHDLRQGKLLFRGQANKSWDLETTLDRKISGCDFNRYIMIVRKIKNELESYIDKDWVMPTDENLIDMLKNNPKDLVLHLPAYSYLVYLRHHGFPSPLLDWTESPYIAAYFAYMNSEKTDPAVYCFIEGFSSLTAHNIGKPMISVLGNDAKTHKRHFLQKACYTIATEWSEEPNTLKFSSYKKLIKLSNEFNGTFYKIILPALGRNEALKVLDEYNINHFTLYQSEDALVKTLEMKFFNWF